MLVYDTILFQMDCSVQILKRGVKIEKRNIGMDYFNCSHFCHFIYKYQSKFIVTPYTIKGESMDPTLKDGERVAVNIVGYKTGGLEKGNVVVFHANKNDALC